MSTDGSCVQCPPYSHNEDREGPCECIDGYYFSQQLGYCTCDPNENPNCVPGCPEGYYYSHQLGNCTCDPNENPNCVPGCPEENQYFNVEFNKCMCRSDLEYVENGKCVECPENHYLDYNTQNCTCMSDNPADCHFHECPPMQILMNGTNCVCENPLQYLGPNGECIDCLPNSNNHDFSGFCDCNEGFFWNQMTQHCHENCQDGHYFNAVLQNCTAEPTNCTDGPGHWQDDLGRCRCTEDFYMGGDEVCHPCPPHMVNTDREGYCECMEGYYFDPNRPDVCIPECDDGYWYSQQLGICTCDRDENPNCVPGCPEGYYYSHQLGDCTCDPNENPDCVTTPGCPEGPGHWMDDIGRCRCSEDFYMAANGTCLICPIHQSNMDMEGPCECLDGFTQHPGKIMI